MTRKQWLALIFSVLAAPAFAGWKEIGRRDYFRVVLIDPQDVQDTKIYWDAIRTICGKGFCNHVFVDDQNFMPPNEARFTDAQLQRALLIYNSGKGFSWNCQFKPYADNCFTP